MIPGAMAGVAAAGVLAVALATNQLGFWLVRRVSQESFYKITMVLMFFISIELLREGMSGIWRG